LEFKVLTLQNWCLKIVETAVTSFLWTELFALTYSSSYSPRLQILYSVFLISLGHKSCIARSDFYF
jgi:hypothetical protein